MQRHIREAIEAARKRSATNAQSNAPIQAPAGYFRKRPIGRLTVPESISTDQNWFVYVLKDPRNNEVRYVGITHSLEHRFKGHLSRLSEPTPKSTWVAELNNLGLVPEMSVIEAGTEWLEGKKREEYWIAYYWPSGRLFNGVYYTPDGKEHRLRIQPKPDPKPSPSFEQHYKISELSDQWGIDEDKIFQVARSEPGVFRLSHMKRSYRVPESVAKRIHARLAA